MSNGIAGIGHIDDDLIYGIDGLTTSQYPFRIVGACANSAKNVFKVKFSRSLSSLPKLYAFDNSTASLNVTGLCTTSNFDIFSGDVENGNKSMLYAVDTSRGVVASNWYVSATIGQGVSNCMLNGYDSYLQFNYSLGSLVAGASLTFNMLINASSGLSQDSTMKHDIAIYYTYTSSTPTAQFYVNNARKHGTDEIPEWFAFYSNLAGILYADSTATLASNQFFMQIPSSGSEVTSSAWVCEQYTSSEQAGGK